MKKAFTMVELVFVIVIVGIIAFFLRPDTSDTRLLRATDQIVSHIRYTQHLAMQDNKFNPIADPNWFRRYWRVGFAQVGNNWTYEISSQDQNGTQVFATNPEDRSLNLTGNGVNPTRALDITENYGIRNVVFAGGCAGVGDIISFDNMGRPLIGDAGAYTSPYLGAAATSVILTTPCNITLTGINGATSSIIIEPETGYTRVQRTN